MDYYVEQKRRDENGLDIVAECFIQESYNTANMTPAHLHKDIEILYCLSGKIKIFLDGRQFDFTKGDMILINAGEVHNIFGASEDKNSYIVIKFSPEILYTTSATIFEAKYVLPFTMNKATHQKLFKSEELRNTQISALLHQAVNEFAAKKYGYELAIRINICRVFLWILRRWNEQGVNLNLGAELTESAVARLQTVFEFVEENFSQPISVEQVAALCNMSYSYFSRYFKGFTGRNFSEYVNFIRITHAEQLLVMGGMNITEVAFEVGFSSTSYFIGLFKQYKGLTPHQFVDNFGRMAK